MINQIIQCLNAPSTAIVGKSFKMTFETYNRVMSDVFPDIVRTNCQSSWILLILQQDPYHSEHFMIVLIEFLCVFPPKSRVCV